MDYIDAATSASADARCVVLASTPAWQLTHAGLRPAASKPLAHAHTSSHQPFALTHSLARLTVTLTPDRSAWVGLPTPLIARLLGDGVPLPLVLRVTPVADGEFVWGGAGS
jgi:hypothetical protein